MIQSLLNPETRAQVRKLEGYNLRDGYSAVGRDYQNDFRGNLPAKYLRVNSGRLVGSANWTSASRGNYETVAKINLHAWENGVNHARDFFNYMWEAASGFTQANVGKALRARRMARSMSSSSKSSCRMAIGSSADCICRFAPVLASRGAGAAPLSVVVLALSGCLSALPGLTGF